MDDEIDNVDWPTALEAILSDGAGSARAVGGVRRCFLPPPLPVLVEGEDEVEVIVALIDGQAWAFHDRVIIGGAPGEVGISRESSRAWPWRVSDGWRSWGGVVPPERGEPSVSCLIERSLEEWAPGPPYPALMRRDIFRAAEHGSGRPVLEVGSELREVISRRRFVLPFAHPSSRRIPRGRSVTVVLSWSESESRIPSRVLLNSPQDWIIDDVRLNGESVLREPGAPADPLGLPGHLFAAASCECEIEVCREPVRGGVVEVTARYDGEDPQGGSPSVILLAEDPETSVTRASRFVGRVGSEK